MVECFALLGFLWRRVKLQVYYEDDYFYTYHFAKKTGEICQYCFNVRSHMSQTRPPIQPFNFQANKTMDWFL
jgi:hypothetical protein